VLFSLFVEEEPLCHIETCHVHLGQIKHGSGILSLTKTKTFCYLKK